MPAEPKSSAPARPDAGPSARPDAGTRRRGDAVTADWLILRVSASGWGGGGRVRVGGRSESHAADVNVEARIRPQSVQARINVEPHHAGVALVDGAIQRGKRGVKITQCHVDGREVVVQSRAISGEGPCVADQLLGSL